MANIHNKLIRQTKAQIRAVEAKLARIALTYGMDPVDPDVARTAESLVTEYGELRRALSAHRSHAKGQQAEI